MKKGFTLIEFLLYTAIVAAVLLAAGAVTFNVLFGKAKLGALAEVSQGGRAAMEQISFTTRNATAINSPATGANAASLSLQVADSIKNPTVFDVQNGILRIKEGATAAVSITPSSLDITGITFTNASTATASSSLRIQLTVKYRNSTGRQEYNVQQTFYTTANRRNR